MVEARDGRLAAAPNGALVRRLARIGAIVCALTGLAFGLLAWGIGRSDIADMAWTAGVIPVLVILVGEIVVSLRQGNFGLDIVAALAMLAALLVGETLAAAVVALMYAGGQALEAFAEGRAGREMTALLDRVPKHATRYRDGALETVPIAAIAPGDRLLIHLGDVLPVDGTVAGAALLDQSALTGESLPVARSDGEAAMSGASNVGAAFDLVAGESAARSTYAGIVRMVEEAARAKAPMARLADRYALGFMAVTIALSLGAWWLSGDAVRAVAVLVVATPCPLILAVPVAIVAGMSRAAGRGVLIKGGGALETLGRIDTLVVDKTGTLTHGVATVTRIVASKGWDEAEILRLAASLDQLSQHAIARALVAEAHRRDLALVMPQDGREVAGEGVDGTIDGRAMRVGGRHHVASALAPDELAALDAAVPAGALIVALVVEGRLAGLILMQDGLRDGVGATLARMRALGVGRIVLATGDRRDVALAVTGDLGLDAVAADLVPQDKIALVGREKAGGSVMMVGDGVNDAPALVAADLGVAMGVEGAAASAEAADIILLRDDLDGLADAMAIARRSRRIALQSVVVGLGLSGLGMLAAAAGYLPPVQGALLQEVIDVAVILNALRALRPG